MESFRDMILNGLYFDNLRMQLKIYFHIVIGDAHSRAKIAFMKLYNGEFSCSVYLNPGEEYARLNRIFKYRPDYELRDEAGYLNDLRIVEESGEPYHGIKGSSCFSEIIL